MTLLLLISLAAPLSLRDAVHRAVEHDPSLRAAGLRIQEASAAETAATGAFDLTLTGEAGLSQSRNLFEFDQLDAQTSLDTDQLDLGAGLVQPLVWGSRLQLAWQARRRAQDRVDFTCVATAGSVGACVLDDTRWFQELRLELNQPLLRGFGRRVNEALIDDARRSRDVAAARRRAEVSAVVAHVVGEYIELAHARATVGIRSQATDLAREQLESTRARVEAGAMAEIDLPVVEQAVAERRQALFIARQQTADRAAALAIRVATDAPLEVSLPAPTAQWTTLEGALEHARSGHPDLAAIDAEIVRQRSQLVTREDATRPQLDLSAGAIQTGRGDDVGGALGRVSDDDIHVYFARLSFALPLANRAAEGALAQARLGLRRAGEERAATVRDIRRDTGEAFRAIGTAEANVELATTLVTLADRTLAAERKKFDHGQATNLDVLRVQQDLAVARLGLARARADRLLADNRLRRLTGSLLTHYELALDDELAP